MNKQLTILLCDDEKAIREYLRKVLEQIPYCKVVGEAGDGAEVVKLYEELKPDVIYLDVEMPVMDGIEAASKIRHLNQEVFIIFGTRYSDYVFDAINHYAYDYMLKPFDENRIKQTIDRICEITDKDYMQSRFCIRCNEHIYFIPMEEICMFEKSGKKLNIYTKYRIYESISNISEVEKRLNNRNEFIRTHRAYIVNINKVTAINKKIGTYEIKLFDIEYKALLSRDRYAILQRILKANY